MRSPFVMITAVRRQVAWYDFEVYCFCCFPCCEAFTFVRWSLWSALLPTYICWDWCIVFYVTLRKRATKQYFCSFFREVVVLYNIVDRSRQQ